MIPSPLLLKELSGAGVLDSVAADKLLQSAPGLSCSRVLQNSARTLLSVGHGTHRGKQFRPFGHAEHARLGRLYAKLVVQRGAEEVGRRAGRALLEDDHVLAVLELKKVDTQRAYSRKSRGRDMRRCRGIFSEGERGAAIAAAHD